MLGRELTTPDREASGVPRMAAPALSRSRSGAYDAPMGTQRAIDEATVSTVVEDHLSFSSAQPRSWSISTKLFVNSTWSFFTDTRAWLPDLRYSYRKDPVKLAAVSRRVGATTQTADADHLASPPRRRSIMSRMVCASPSHVCASDVCASPPHDGVLPGAECTVYVVQGATRKNERHDRAPKP